MSADIISLLIADCVIEWFRDDNIPELHGDVVWVCCGDKNDKGESPYCAVELPQVGELSDLATLLLAVGAMQIQTNGIAFVISDDRLREFSCRNRNVLLLVISRHPTISQVFSAIVYHAHGSSNN